VRVPAAAWLEGCGFLSAEWLAFPVLDVGSAHHLPPVPVLIR
jgi:hypothetical protein